jgi:hypothetical protein
VAGIGVTAADDGGCYAAASGSGTPGMTVPNGISCSWSRCLWLTVPEPSRLLLYGIRTTFELNNLSEVITNGGKAVVIQSD